MNYEYLCVNPKRKREGDCVVRAIANAEQKQWETVYMRLCSIGLHNYRMPNSQKTYEEYLAENGWTKYPQPRKENGKKYTIQEWADLMAERNLNKSLNMIVTMANHMTMVGLDYGTATLYDTWNCSYKCVSNFWVKW